MSHPFTPQNDAELVALWEQAPTLTPEEQRAWVDLSDNQLYDFEDEVWADIQKRVLTELTPVQPRPWRRTARPSQIPPRGLWRHWLIMAGRGWGKALDLRTMIPTPSGFRKLSELAIGDQVFDESGRPCKITGIYEPTPRKAYRLTFSDGTTIDACDEHQWVTWTHADRKAYLRSPYEPDTSRFPEEWPAWRLARKHRHWPEPRRDSEGPGPCIRTTQEIVDTLTYGKRGDLNHSIPTAGPLRLPDADLPIDPWLLGYWLGDGHTNAARLTVAEADLPCVLERLHALGLTPKVFRRFDRAPSVALYGGLVGALRDLGVLGSKHVPEAYLWASIEQREALLQGLMDSDGYAEPSKVEFTSTTRALADAVVQLARSLGQKPVLHEERATLYGRDCGPKFRVSWRATRQPFSLARKVARVDVSGGSQGLRNHHRMIVSAEEVPPVPMRCLTVDGPHHMYLAGESMTPTHNTFVGANWLAERSISDAGDYAVVAPTLGDAKKICVEGESGLLAALGGEFGPNVKTYNRSDYVITLTNGSRIILGSADAPQRIRGLNLRGVWCVAEGEPVETRRGRIPIEQVRPGDEVMTRDGWRKVTAAVKTKKNASTLRIKTSAGALRCTADHPVWVVDKGWTLAGEVKPGDTLLSWKNEKSPWSDTQIPSPDRQHGSSGTASAGIAPVMGITRNATVSCCTMPSGPPSTDPSPTDTRSITVITIAPTTCTETSKHSNAASTPATTAALATTFGAPTTPIMPSSQSEQKPHGNGESPATSRARSAAPSTSRLASEPSFATSIAPLETVVESVENDSASDVYDLTVEDAHEFYAGDGSLLVHNCDEVGSWKDPTVWNEGIRFATRKGDPRIVITTTPTRGNKILVKLLDDFKNAGGSILGGHAGTLHLTRGSTRENVANLSRDWLDEIEEEFGGTTLGRQELDGELLHAVPGALVTLDIIEHTRLTALQVPEFRRIVVAVDPATTSKDESDECGIIVGGIGPPPLNWEPPKDAPPSLADASHIYWLEDWSIRATPETWARRALQAAEEWDADCIVAEVNQGGDLVTTMTQMVAQNEGLHIPRLKKVHAAVGKRTRAEPVGGVWQQHRCHVVGTLKQFEDQWQTWVPGSGQNSPDRLDAGVWNAVELMPRLAIKSKKEVRLIA